MRRWRISRWFSSSSLPQSQMQRPILHLRRTRRNARPKRYVRAMFYCRGGAERCLEEVQIAPHATFFASTKSPSNCVMSSGHSTISRPHPALKRYKQRVHTMDHLIVSFQCWAGSADEDINLFLVGGKNYSWQLHEGHDGEIDGLGSKIGPKP